MIAPVTAVSKTGPEVPIGRVIATRTYHDCGVCEVQLGGSRVCADKTTMQRGRYKWRGMSLNE